jgi:asparagine synthase (glutamine-hydrolysing)
MLARQFDEPMIDSSMVPTYLVSKLIRQHCTVALGGDGGDELFAGYAHYNRLLRLQQNVRQVPKAVRQTVAHVATAALPIGFRGRNWAQALGTDWNSGLPHVAVHFDATARRRLMGHYGWPTVAETVWRDRVPAAADLLERATRMDFENYLPEDILVKVDRASMLTSLEVRAPILDYRIIEFAFGKVPSKLKATVSERKILLKKLARKVLPPEFDHQRKQGFSIPLRSWLESGPWHKFFNDVLRSSAPGTFNKDMVGALLDGQARGRHNSERLFGLVMFELWRQEYQVTV